MLLNIDISPLQICEARGKVIEKLNMFHQLEEAWYMYVNIQMALGHIKFMFMCIVLLMQHSCCSGVRKV